jgi:tetratricopeptide (TPR) repeat protein
MPRLRITLTIVALLFTSARSTSAQSLADAKLCERAIRGSATDRAALVRASAARPAAPLARFASGCLSVIALQWDSAGAQFDAAARGNPRSSAAFLWVGNISGQRARMGDMTAKVRLAPAVREAYLKAIALDGANVDARESLMQFLIEAPANLGGNLKQAGEQAAAITRLDAFRGLGAQLAVASAGHETIVVERLLTQATVQFPDSLIGWANLSALQADAQRAADAFATIARWQARGTSPLFALFSIGRTAAVTGMQLDRGEQSLKQYLRSPQRGANDPPVANANYRLGQIHERQNRKADAIAAYTLALRSNPRLRDAQVALDRLR